MKCTETLIQNSNVFTIHTLLDAAVSLLVRKKWRWLRTKQACVDLGLEVFLQIQSSLLLL